MISGTIIVGAGYCGASAAFAMRENGYTGPITLIGSEAEYPYERPPISKWDTEGLASPRLIHPAEYYREKDIALLRDQTVISIDRDKNNVKLDGDKTLPYDQLLITTGASARKFDDEKFPGIEINYLRSYEDAKKLRGHVSEGDNALIIGAGFIGLELAASLSIICKQVIVLEAQDRVLSRALPPVISRRLSKIHSERGVDILNGTTIRSLTERDNKKFVTCSNGDIFEVDVIIAGIGAAPNTELAVDAGLLVDNGINVDHNFKTNDSSIFAAGDCASRLASDGQCYRFESWQMAGEQGEMVGAIMAGTRRGADIVPWFWSDQLDYTLQVTGMDNASSIYHERILSDKASIVFQLNDQDHLIYAAGIGKGTEISKDIRIMQKMIEKKIEVNVERLADKSENLKRLLRA